MITDLIVAAFLAGLDAILSLIPTWNPFSLADESPNLVAQTGWGLNRVVPVILAVQLMAAAIGLRLLFNAYDAVLWVYHQFWGAS